MQNHISFEIEQLFGSLVVTPFIDGSPLPDLVKAFELRCGFPDVGNYAGIIPSGFKYGPLDRYFLGSPLAPSYWEELGGFYVLGCAHCGDVGCWPLICSITRLHGDVMWSKFRQPHRPKWDYTNFGPFIFDGDNYSSALEKLMADLAGTTVE